GGCGGCSKSSAPRISAGGATFINPLMQKWSGEYNQKKKVEIDYVSKGSGYGIEQMTARTIDFGCSDAPMSKKQLDMAKEKGGDVFHIPLTMGAVAVVYNVPEIAGKELKLTGDVLADIYRRDPSVQKWNAKRISDLNPGLSLPDKDIVVVARAEKSGTSNIFSEYLSKVSEGKIKASTKPDWPQGVIGQEGNDGVAGFVKSNTGTIGYVELLFAKKNELPTARLKNKAGEWVMPDADGVTAAAAEALKMPPDKEPYSLHDLTYSLTDADGKTSYPICGISYGLLFAKQPKDKGPVIVEFLKWATTDGQVFAKDMDYAPLPDELRKKIGEKLGQVKFE
ncbi:MAG: phosphate ABC transporter substrate-binding protein PstS, partial [Planctomycetia bacterium]|nr:phosphate ABC transporter substrate-binding protein PstS [Planctomycetia bacterium]